MQPDMYQFITSKPEYKEFIRFHPHWYRRLNANPETVYEFIEEARRYHGQTLPQKLERWKSNMDLALMLFNLISNK
ncbi:YlbE-like family protein [Alteribacillus iranensis]|uniref:YlbE-like protein n=1 Tax=Alteribacillus iranensis TaxID=930128 RepID=A0A1I2AGJ9_9BACI|nr:YlbE-like family protein [Alteribacillus iranensis]SFE41970.1 YlbE-like protein [Alteribacillus iranensis]